MQQEPLEELIQVLGIIEDGRYELGLVDIQHLQVLPGCKGAGIFSRLLESSGQLLGLLAGDSKARFCQRLRLRPWEDTSRKTAARTRARN